MIVSSCLRHHDWQCLAFRLGVEVDHHAENKLSQVRAVMDFQEKAHLFSTIFDSFFPRPGPLDVLGFFAGGLRVPRVRNDLSCTWTKIDAPAAHSCSHAPP